MTPQLLYTVGSALAILAATLLLAGWWSPDMLDWCSRRLAARGHALRSFRLAYKTELEARPRYTEERHLR